jgi:hypothetical protein
MNTILLPKLYKKLETLCEIKRHTLEISLDNITFWWDNGNNCEDFDNIEDAIYWANNKIDDWLAN